MLAKFGFILLVLAFGLLMFVAGMFAPASVHDPLTAALARTGLVAPTPAETPAPAAGTQNTDTPKETPPLPPYESLLLVSPLPENDGFGIQVGLFTDASAAAPMTERIKALGHAAQLIEVADKRGAPWTVLVAGQFPAADEAETARAALSQQLGVPLPLPLVVLPKKLPVSQTAP